MTTTLHTARRPQGRSRVTALLLTGSSNHRVVVSLLTWLGASGMVVSGAIHLHLYALAYRHIPTIGPLFVVQGVAAVLLALTAAVLRRVWTALLGTGMMLATLAGFLISVNYGLFGFQDSFAGSDAVGAFVVEIVSAVLCLAAAAFALRGRTARSDWAGGTAQP